MNLLICTGRRDVLTAHEFAQVCAILGDHVHTLVTHDKEEDPVVLAQEVSDLVSMRIWGRPAIYQSAACLSENEWWLLANYQNLPFIPRWELDGICY